MRANTDQSKGGTTMNDDTSLDEQISRRPHRCPDLHGSFQHDYALKSRLHHVVRLFVAGNARPDLDLIIPEHLRPAHWKGFDAANATGIIKLQGRPALDTSGARERPQALHRDDVCPGSRTAMGRWQDLRPWHPISDGPLEARDTPRARGGNQLKNCKLVQPTPMVCTSRVF